MHWMLPVVLVTAVGAQQAPTSQSDASAAPRSQAPIGDMRFAPGRWTLTPAAGVVQVNTTTDTETNGLFLPSLGLGAVYTFSERWAAYAAIYGTRWKGTVDGNLLNGELTIGLGISTLGVAFNIYGCERASTFRAVAAAGIMAGRVTGDYRLGILKARLYTLDVSAATIALQAEWRPWAYLSIVPHAIGWRLLAVQQKAGGTEATLPVDNEWHGGTGLDLWLYPIPSVDSHLSLGMLFAFGGDEPVSSFTLSWTFIFGEEETLLEEEAVEEESAETPEAEPPPEAEPSEAMLEAASPESEADEILDEMD